MKKLAPAPLPSTNPWHRGSTLRALDNNSELGKTKSKGSTGANSDAGIAANTSTKPRKPKCLEAKEEIKGTKNLKWKPWPDSIFQSYPQQKPTVKVLPKTPPNTHMEHLEHVSTLDIPLWPCDAQWPCSPWPHPGWVSRADDTYASLSSLGQYDQENIPSDYDSSVPRWFPYYELPEASQLIPVPVFLPPSAQALWTSVNYEQNYQFGPQSEESSVAGLCAAAKAQLSYYFSKENLIKDIHLRKMFDEQTGAVLLADLLEFPSLKYLLQNNLELLESVAKDCEAVEFLGGEFPAVRVEDWQTWKLPPEFSFWKSS